MQTRVHCRVAVFAATLPFAAFAQGTATDRPLSAIDWLNAIPQSKPVVLLPEEPKVASGANVPNVSVTTLDGPAAQIIGLVPSNISGLPRSLWTGSGATVLSKALDDVPSMTLPAAQAMLFTLLLAEADPAQGTSSTFDLARVDALIKLGALDPALALIEQIGPSKNSQISRRFIDASLLNETEDAACNFITANPFLAPDYSYRIFCAARGGDWDTATLTLGTARALGAIPPENASVLERFLDPDLFEGDATLAPPVTQNPLMFRMHEALGQPISTRSWPAIYANADLRDVAGWKKQIEAAERLSKTGALPANRLLGIYSERQPAASGSIWDRVKAVQRFETAMNTGNQTAIAKTLPKAWEHMQSAGLSVPFATLFSDRLLEIDLPGPLHGDAFSVVQSGAQYEIATQTYPEAAKKHPFRTSIAAGEVNSAFANSALETAIARGFAQDSADEALVKTAKDGQLGLALLQNLTTLHAGAQGDMGQLSTALATMRALGLEDAARRAALQLLIGQNSP